MPARSIDPKLRRQVGRPSRLTDPAREVVERDAHGNQTGTRVLMIAEAVLADISTGASIVAACRRAGITPSTFYEWEHHGHQLRVRPPQDPVTKRERHLTAEERRLVEFSYAADTARAEGELRPFGTVAGAAMRPQVTTRRTTVTETDGQGKVVLVRETEVVEEKPPSVTAAMFMLERQHRHWMPRTAQEVTGEEGAPLLPVEALASSVLAKLAAIRAGTPIDVDSHELPLGGDPAGPVGEP